MEVSVIVPVYNRIENLKYLIYCLKKQSYPINELIISDDGSSVDVVSFLKEEVKGCNFKIKYVWQTDLGFRKTRALNNAVKETKSDILLFLDQDIIFPFNLVEKILKVIRKDYFIPFKVYYMSEDEKNNFIKENKECNFEYNSLKLDEKQIKKIKKKVFNSRIKNLKYSLGLKDRGTNLTGGAYAIYKENYIRVNGYDEEYRSWGKEDDDFAWRVYKSGGKSKIINLDYPIIHLWHYTDPTKGGDMNQKLFLEKKNKLNKNNFRCKYGYDNSFDNDKVKVIEIKGWI